MARRSDRPRRHRLSTADKVDVAYLKSRIYVGGGSNAGRSRDPTGSADRSIPRTLPSGRTIRPASMATSPAPLPISSTCMPAVMPDRRNSSSVSGSTSAACRASRCNSPAERPNKYVLVAISSPWRLTNDNIETTRGDRPAHPGAEIIFALHTDLLGSNPVAWGEDQAFDFHHEPRCAAARTVASRGAQFACMTFPPQAPARRPSSSGGNITAAARTRPPKDVMKPI